MLTLQPRMVAVKIPKVSSIKILLPIKDKEGEI
jgi:hypothetical protein